MLSIIFNRCNTSITSEFDCLANRKNAFHGYLVKSGCPVAWPNDSVKEMCFNRTMDDPRTIIPVIDYETKVTFANVFCAVCNGAKNYTFLKIRMLIEIEDLMDKALPRYNLSYHTIKKTQWWIESNFISLEEFCIPTSFQAPKTITNNTLWSLCNSYAMPVYRSIDGKKFKNPHCGQLLSVAQNVSFQCSKVIEGRLSMEAAEFILPAPSVVKILEVVTLNSEPIMLPPPIIKETIEFNGSVCEQQVIYSSRKHKIYQTQVVFAPSKKRVDERYNNIKYLILTCGNSTFEFVSSDDTISALITIVGFAISIPSLLFFLLTHILFCELRSLNGKNLVSLSCAMLAFQSFFLASGNTRVTTVCDIITGFLHYTLLAMFAWMSVVGYDVTMTFASKCKLNCIMINKSRECL